MDGPRLERIVPADRTNRCVGRENGELTADEQQSPRRAAIEIDTERSCLLSQGTNPERDPPYATNWANPILARRRGPGPGGQSMPRIATDGTEFQFPLASRARHLLFRDGVAAVPTCDLIPDVRVRCGHKNVASSTAEEIVHAHGSFFSLQHNKRFRWSTGIR